MHTKASNEHEKEYIQFWRNCHQSQHQQRKRQETRCLVTGQHLTVVDVYKSQGPIREGSCSHQPLDPRACGVLSLFRLPPDPRFSHTFLQTTFILSAQRPYFQQRGTINSWLLNHYLIRERIPEERFLLYAV